MPAVRKKIVVIVGPTAAGKSSIALALAPLLNGEIITADSMQVYRGMDIGTAKPTREERTLVPHHLLDIVAPDVPFHAIRYQHEADQVIERVTITGKVPFVVGGTGLYVKALLRGLFQEPACPSFTTWTERISFLESLSDDPWEKLARIDPDASRIIHRNDRIRAQRALEVYLNTGRSILAFQREHGFRTSRYVAIVVGLTRERKELYKRIEHRVDRMMEQGLLEETRGLLAQGYSADLPSMKGLGYRHMVAHLGGETDLEEAVHQLKRDSMRYAKRQWTWFRNQENAAWFDTPYPVEEIAGTIKEFLSQN